MDLDETLTRITLLALEDDGFRMLWDTAVRDGADLACAAVARGRLRGREASEMEWHAKVPYPVDLPEEAVDSAYRYVVCAEVERRLGIETNKEDFR